ncbi:MAG: FAD-dependent oxidoreductase [Actinobacteria bacterium RBG_16_68_21]|nr:MAG: FAD-dependent oxidoreductase [Actinobacteria bacterium RBG_16_68_21]
MLDAVIVGGGPNGLTAAITLASAGKRVMVLEAGPTVGGGARTAELTLPGIRHDVCSAVHPLGIGSPVLSALPLSQHGLAWAHPPVAMAHPLDGGRAGVLTRDLDETVDGLGSDGAPWRATFGSVAARWNDSVRLALAAPLAALRTPIAGARFGRLALQPATMLVRRFSTPEGRALVAGIAAHAAAPLSTVGTAGVALTLGAAAHTVGWPVAVGGSGAITEAMAAHLVSLGGEIRTDATVTTWSDLPEARVIVFDTGPAAAAAILGDRLSRYSRRAYRRFRHGPGVFKLDVALDGPIPWANASCRLAGTVHVGGTYEEITAAERAVAAGEHPERPFVISSQPLVADPGRAPQGTHVLWAYCHVPARSRLNMTERIFDQFERFAPGFRDRVVAVSARGPAELEADNANLVGGDITGGALSVRGLMARPSLFRPYKAGRGAFICSSSTPPGAGVHGMCGWHAARAALRELG